MSDYKNPRPSPSASASDPCVVYDNSVSFDKLINESEVVITYKGVELQSVPSLLEQIEAEANAEVGSLISEITNLGLQAVESVGWTPVGEFATGFTYTKLNDVGRDALGSWWRYNGSDLPKVIAAGTVPSSPNFSVISFETADNVQWEIGKSVGYSLDDLQGFTEELLAQAGIVPSGLPDELGASQRVDAMRQMFTNVGTVADIADGKFKVGAVVGVKNRANWLFEIITGGNADGFGVLSAGGSDTAVLINNGLADITAYGAKGDYLLFNGSINPNKTDNYLAIKAAIASGLPLYIPSGHFFTSRGLVSKQDVECKGFIVLADSAPNNEVAWTLDISNWPRDRHVSGLRVISETNQFSTGKMGIKAWDPIILMTACRASGFNYGIGVATYGVTLNGCVANNNETNLTMFKSLHSDGSFTEINDITVIGGDYTSAVNQAMVIGDTRLWPDDPTGSPQGVQILVQGTAFDAGSIWIKNVFNVRLDTCYQETSSESFGIRIGDPASSTMTRLVTISGMYFSDIHTAVYAETKSADIKVEPCFYNDVSVCFYANPSIAGVSFMKPASVHPIPVLVHTGVPWDAIGDIQFRNYTIEPYGITNGVQVNSEANRVGVYGYTPASTVVIPGGTRINTATGGRTYDIPNSATGVASGNNVTLNTLADAFKFNGGDAIGTGFIRVVNYLTGVVTLSFAPPSGVYTLSQKKTKFRTSAFTYQAPTTGYWEAGDACENTFTVTFNVSGWVCTAGGNPGTWVGKALP